MPLTRLPARNRQKKSHSISLPPNYLLMLAQIEMPSRPAVRRLMELTLRLERQILKLKKERHATTASRKGIAAGSAAGKRK